MYSCNQFQNHIDDLDPVIKIISIAPEHSLVLGNSLKTFLVCISKNSSTHILCVSIYFAYLSKDTSYCVCVYTSLKTEIAFSQSPMGCFLSFCKPAPN